MIDINSAFWTLDNEFFESYILEDNGSADNEAETPSQHRLLKAKEFLAEWIRRHPDKAMVIPRCPTSNLPTTTRGQNFQWNTLFRKILGRVKLL